MKKLYYLTIDGARTAASVFLSVRIDGAFVKKSNKYLHFAYVFNFDIFFLTQCDHVPYLFVGNKLYTHAALRDWT